MPNQNSLLKSKLSLIFGTNNVKIFQAMKKSSTINFSQLITVKTKFTFLMLAFFLAACSSKILSPVQTDADRGAAKFPGLTLSQLSQGKMLYEQNCGKCHKLKKPTSLNEDGWNKIVPIMAKKAKVDNDTEGLILQYLVVMCEKGK